MLILYVEPDAKLAMNVSDCLSRSGFATEMVGSGAEAVRAVGTHHYDAIILDLLLPDMQGLDLLRAFKRLRPDLPVLVCTALDALDDRVTGLASGSDDYLVKPIDPAELLAHVKAVLRRPGFAHGPLLNTGNVIYDTTDRSVTVDGTLARMSRRELDLLELFMRRKGRILSKESIQSSLYGAVQPTTLNAIEVALHRLRKRLSDLGATVTVHTYRGVGYLMEDNG